MIYYHLQHYFALDDEWHDIPHCNGGCSASKEDILEVYDRLINLPYIRLSEYRIILSGTSDYLPLPSRQYELTVQLTLF